MDASLRVLVRCIVGILSLVLWLDNGSLSKSGNCIVGRLAGAVVLDFKTCLMQLSWNALRLAGICFMECRDMSERVGVNSDGWYLMQ